MKSASYVNYRPIAKTGNIPLCHNGRMPKLAQLSLAQKEYIAELLKERIYATLALLAVLISIDADHTSPLRALFIVAGTIFSLWAASVVALQMSKRVVFQGEIDPDHAREQSLRKHAPMLAVLPFPLLMISLSLLEVLPLGLTLDISIVVTLLLLITWSLLSARALRVTRLSTFIIAGVELLIGLAVVALKVALGH
jgi:hypothetical protein